jgi:catechol 2,3-dioxygenase-like lactoylglutathione lyase family enzyme
MTIELLEINHINVTVPASLEAAAKHFYGVVLGLRQIPKPKGTRTGVGAWYDLGHAQLHLSIEDGVDNRASSRHVCYLVTDIEAAESHLRQAEIEVLPDERPVRGWPRFYVRDPGDNLIEIAQDRRSGITPHAG